ncbi:MAG: hypothetical protein N4A53_13685 [Pelagimonas sp.]|jgi:hypothetical protein|nr:hypothetical protein [Pelagimonas sp.]
MNSIEAWALAIGLIATMASFPQKSAAEGFTGTDFLQWDRVGQDSYINTAVVMATFVSTRTNPKTAECLNGWYAESAEISQSRNDKIRNLIAKNASYHPSGVILLVLEEACGSFAATD